VEDNPHLSEDGQTLYFDSNRSDINGTTCIDESGGLERSIYVSEFDGGTWSRPAGIQGIPNESAFAWQVFVRQEGLYIYWSGECTGGISCLFRARRLPNGSYGEETLIAQAETCISCTSNTTAPPTWSLVLQQPESRNCGDPNVNFLTIRRAFVKIIYRYS
jgi:hypothetical protein